jgi:hypothetical protein
MLPETIQCMFDGGFTNLLEDDRLKGLLDFLATRGQ